MSKLSDEVDVFRKKLTDAGVPTELTTRVQGNLDEILRTEHDISSRAQIDQIFR